MLSSQTRASQHAAAPYSTSTAGRWKPCAGYWTRNSGQINSTLAVSGSQSKNHPHCAGQLLAREKRAAKNTVGVKNSEIGK